MKNEKALALIDVYIHELESTIGYNSNTVSFWSSSSSVIIALMIGGGAIVIPLLASSKDAGLTFYTQSGILLVVSIFCLHMYGEYSKKEKAHYKQNEYDLCRIIKLDELKKSILLGKRNPTMEQVKEKCRDILEMGSDVDV